MNRMTIVVASAALVLLTSCLTLREPDRQVRITTASPAAAFEKLRALGGMFEVAASAPTSDAEPLRALRVTTNWFQVSQNPPLLGRPFLADEGRVPTVVILSSHAWQRLFGKDPAIVGKIIDVGTNKCTVVGIVPDRDSNIDVYFPWMPSGDGYSLIALLRPGVTVKQAQAAIDTAGIQAKLE